MPLECPTEEQAATAHSNRVSRPLIKGFKYTSHIGPGSLSPLQPAACRFRNRPI